MFKTALAVALLLICGAGHAGLGHKPITAPKKVQVDGDNFGIVFGSVGATTQSVLDSFTMLYGPAGAIPTGRIGWQYGPFFGDKPMFTDGDDELTVFQLKLPPGTYQIADVDFFFNGGTVQIHFRASSPFSIPFVIEKGKATYLGRFIGRELETGSGWLSQPDGGYFVVRNALTDDLAGLRLLLPGQSFDVLAAVPDVEKLRSRYFRIK